MIFPLPALFNSSPARISGGASSSEGKLNKLIPHAVVAFLLLIAGCGEEDSMSPPPPLVISLPRMFNYSASVGKTWEFSGVYHQQDRGYAGGAGYWWHNYDRSGIQRWTVDSLSVRGRDTIVYLTSAKRDTAHLYNWSMGLTDTIVFTTLDSTFLPADTAVHFSMRLSLDSISVNFRPTLYGWLWGESYVQGMQNFSRTLGAGTDTVTANAGAGWVAHYVSGVGFVDCSLSGGGNSYTVSERLKLLR
jgi:hypothetical protein